MTLVAQLVHLSDLHLTAPGDRPQAKRSGVWSLLSSVCPKLRDGMMGHDHSALDEFDDALSYVVLERLLGTDLPPSNPQDTAEVKAKTWLVCTGDLSTVGDVNRSVQHGLDWLEHVARAKQIGFCCIYGNHDVWHGGVPADNTELELTTNRKLLRAQRFPGTWPLVPIANGAGNCGSTTNPPLRFPMPHSSRELVVTSLNTVAHERIPNTLAYGTVREDRYWEPGHHDDQLQELELRAQRDQVRIVLTHHPVHFPNPPRFGMAILNERTVGSALSQPIHGSPLGTVILSGHTHETFPEAHSLPPALPRTAVERQAPLDLGQAQLVVGTLSQRAHRKNKVRHEFACVRIYEYPDGRIELEREIWRRRGPGPSGKFGPVKDVNDQWVEPMQLS